MAVDTGLILLTQTNMQNGVDAAALAASQFNYIQVSAQNQSAAVITANSAAVANARSMAADVASANGVYIDSTQDVIFGKRSFNAATNTWPIQWDVEPYNVVKVLARRTNTDTTAPIGG